MPSEVKGFESLLGKLNAEKLMAEPMRKFYKRAAVIAQRYARQLSPVDTGRLRGSITYEVDAAEFPTFAAIGSVVEYAPYVEYGTGTESDGPNASGKPHFPAGVSAKTGRVLKGFPGFRPRRYLRDAIQKLRSDMPALLAQLGKDAAAAWDKK